MFDRTASPPGFMHPKRFYNIHLVEPADKWAHDFTDPKPKIRKKIPDHHTVSSKILEMGSSYR